MTTLQLNFYDPIYITFLFKTLEVFFSFFFFLLSTEEENLFPLNGETAKYCKDRMSITV